MVKKLLEDYNKKIEKRINQLFPATNEKYAKVFEAARYSLLLGGKRIRPIILTEFCKLFGGNTVSVIDFAIALEMIHTYSLIHDDLPCMDDDDMRRGKPSCHIAYGEDIALLAGDTLLTEAFSIVANANVSDKIKIKIISVLSKRAGGNGMIAGQVLDLSFEKSTPNVDELTDMYIKKTAHLLCAAAEIGCITAECDDQTIEKASCYAENLGLAFQIIDDILDLTADDNILGKPTGSDDKNGKTTYVTILGLEKSRKIAQELTEKALTILKDFNGETKNLEEITKFLLSRNY